jgi:hypothetical protein
MGFAMQSFIGIGAYFASKLPLILPITEFENTAPLGIIPDSVKYPLPWWNCIYCYRSMDGNHPKEYLRRAGSF